MKAQTKNKVTYTCSICKKTKTIGYFQKNEREPNKERCNHCIKKINAMPITPEPPKKKVKTCITCLKELPIDTFSKIERTKGDKGRCGTCVNKEKLKEKEKANEKLRCSVCKKSIHLCSYPKEERTKGILARCGVCAKQAKTQKLKEEEKKERKAITAIISSIKETVIGKDTASSIHTTASLRTKVLERDRHTCHYCHQTGHATIDHKIPVSRGGQNTMENCVCACRFCNYYKGNLHYEDFLVVLHKLPACEWLDMRKKWLATL